MVELFEFSAPTLYKWKKHEKRKIFTLLDSYFSKKDLEEFLATGKMSKLETLNHQNSYLTMLYDELAGIKNKLAEIEKIIK